MVRPESAALARPAGLSLYDRYNFGIVTRRTEPASLLGFTVRSPNDAGTKKKVPAEKLVPAQQTEPVRQNTIANWPRGAISRGPVKFHFWISNSSCRTSNSPSGSTNPGVQ